MMSTVEEAGGWEYEWVDYDGEMHRTATPPNPCETPLPVRQVRQRPAVPPQAISAGDDSRSSVGAASKPVALRVVSDDEYTGDAGLTMKREYGRTPNANHLGGAWVLRRHGWWVDFDLHRYDLAERHGVHLDHDEVAA